MSLFQQNNIPQVEELAAIASSKDLIFSVMLIFCVMILSVRWLFGNECFIETGELFVRVLSKLGALNAKVKSLFLLPGMVAVVKMPRGL